VNRDAEPSTADITNSAIPNSHDAVVLDFSVSGVVDVRMDFYNVWACGCCLFSCQCLSMLPHPTSHIHPPAHRQVQVTTSSGYLNWAGYIFQSTETLPFIAAKHAKGVNAEDTAQLEVNSKRSLNAVPAGTSLTDPMPHTLITLPPPPSHPNIPADTRIAWMNVSRLHYVMENDEGPDNGGPNWSGDWSLLHLVGLLDQMCVAYAQQVMCLLVGHASQSKLCSKLRL
jgi:hypothetical protein